MNVVGSSGWLEYFADDGEGNIKKNPSLTRVFLLAMLERYQAALCSNSARAGPIPRRYRPWRATQRSVMCVGVPMALPNCCSILPAVAMNWLGSIAQLSSSRGVSPGMKPRLSSRITRSCQVPRPHSAAGLRQPRKPCREVLLSRERRDLSDRRCSAASVMGRSAVSSPAPISAR